jgi:RimJ/RimL family protein N-acetyltransferase
MSLPFMEALQRRDLAAAEHLIGARVPTHMPDDLEHFLEFRIADLTTDPAWQPWLGRAIVLDDPRAGRRVIGSIGFHSPPDETGQVEVGYRVEPEFRRQGVATEVVRALFEWAYREHGIRRFRASTSPDNLASQAVLARFGFVQTGSQMDDYDGEELVFESNDWTPSR